MYIFLFSFLTGGDSMFFLYQTPVLGVVFNRVVKAMYIWGRYSVPSAVQLLAASYTPRSIDS